MKRNKMVGVSIDEDLLISLQEIAEKNRWTISSTIYYILKEYIEGRKKTTED